MQKNSSQERAVSHNRGPMMLLAGPGSGKTTTITRRVANLIKEYQVTPSSILVVTFTKAAAREMKERFLRLCEKEGMAGPYREVTFGTFHGIFTESCAMPIVCPQRTFLGKSGNTIF